VVPRVPHVIKGDSSAPTPGWTVGVLGTKSLLPPIDIAPDKECWFGVRIGVRKGVPSEVVMLLMKPAEIFAGVFPPGPDDRPMEDMDEESVIKSALRMCFELILCQKSSCLDQKR